MRLCLFSFVVALVALTLTSASNVRTRLFVFGGLEMDLNLTKNSDLYEFRNVDMYDIDSASWTGPGARNLPTVREKHAATTFDGRIYVTGGNDGEFSPSFIPSATTLVYTPETNTWKKLASMNIRRQWHGIAELGGKIYVVGGFGGIFENETLSMTNLRTAESFDPKANRWTLIAAMNISRGYMAAAALNNRVYAIGGVSTPFTETLSSVEAYDPKTGNWSTVAPMNIARYAHCAAAAAGHVFAIGGLAEKSVEKYNPDTDRWTVEASLSTKRQFCAAAVSPLGDQLYVVGGFSLDIWKTLDTVEVYDLMGSTWTILPARMPFPRYDHAAAFLEYQLPDTYFRKGFAWTFGDKPFDLAGQYKRCEDEHRVGNCELYGGLVYPKCQPEYHIVDCCLCVLGDRGRSYTRPGYPFRIGDKAGDQQKRCEADHQDGCEKVGAIVYPKCASGYKAVGCCICARQ